MTDKYAFLASELNELESILNMIPKENVIDRLAIESRLAGVKSEIKTLSLEIPVEKAKITFRGAPVVGSKGVLVNFASKAMGVFSEAFASVVSAMDDTLKNEGRLPNAGKNQLLITGVVTGSFGFELAIPHEDDLYSNTSASMSSILNLLETTANKEDEAVAQLIEDIHPRAIRKIKEFLDCLIQNGAWFSIQFGDKLFRFTDIDELKNSSERLCEQNIKEGDETFTGTFLGILPHSRTFEFQVSGGDLIRGKVDKSLGDLLSKKWLNKQMNVKFNYLQFREGKPRYTLKNPPN